MQRKIVVAATVVGVLALAVAMLWLVRGPRAVSAPAGAPGLDLSGDNVLLITLDTTRADRIGAYGYADARTPRLDALASEGVLFEQVVTPTAFTLPSHASIMTGLYPPYHGVRLNGGVALAEGQVTLAERLNAAGYRCGAFVAAFVIDQRWGLGQGFERYDDDFEMADGQKLDLAGVQRPADRVIDLALEWLEADDERPFFTWIHLYDPHIPYEPPEPFRSHFSGRGASGLYDGEIAFADSQVGRVLDWLEARGAADDTLVVVVGDHGESLGEHGESEHGYYIYDATVRVPLILRLPGSGTGGLRVAQQVRTVDVMPTVLDLLGVEPPQTLHGESLEPMISVPSRAEPKLAYSESMAVHLQYGWSALYGLRTQTHKYIGAPRAELYDLRSDHGERDNLVHDRADLAEELRTRLAELRREIESGAPETEAADLDQETLGMLAALGYVGGASATPHGEDLADPKDTIHLFEAVAWASQRMLADDYQEGAEVLERVLAEDPEIPQAQHMLATCYRQTGRTEEAKHVLDEYLRDHPDSTPALITMAGILSDEGSYEEVVALARKVLAVDDHNAQAYALMAGAYMQSRDHAAALPLLEKAVEIQPKLTRNRLNLAVANISLGRLDVAEPMLEEILAEHPKFPLAHFHLGLVHEERGRPSEACDAYREELELHPNAVTARFNLGNLLLELGDLEGAAAQMRAIIEEAPEVPRSYLLLARILLKQERELAEVEDLARTGLERTDDDDLKVLGYYLLADVYSRQGRQAELQEVLARARVHRSRLGR